MTTRDHTKGPSQRQLQVGEELRHAAVQILQRGGFDHPLLMDGSRITISEVSVSPDLKNATFYVMTLGGIDLRDTMQALHAFARMIRHELSKRVRLRYMPQIRFEEDRTFAHADHIDRLIRSANIPQDE